MEYDSSDILGHRTMPTTKGKRQGGFSFGRAFFLCVVLLAIYLFAKRVWKRYTRYREQGYKLATRRRHGIPDSDLRPFNVAYSEAMAKAREEELRRQPRPKPIPRPQPAPVDQRAAQLEQSLRQRSAVAHPPEAGSRNSVIPIPGGYSTGSYLPPLPARTSLADGDPRTLQGVVDRYNHRLPIGQPALPSHNGVSREGLARRGGYSNIEDADTASDEERRKRGPEGVQDDEHEAKKSKVEGDELIDGDEDAEFEEFAPKRGSKRAMREEEDIEEVAGSKKSRGKRARKVSNEKKGQIDQSMDVDDDEEADEITELKSTIRGKKRDRAEAGSTFGGDDDESASEIEEGDSKARRRRRKRRTVAKRKSEATYLRGKKRDRIGEEDVSDHGSAESSPDVKATRKRKGRRSSNLEQLASKSDVSMDSSTTSSKGKVRKIGDEWESNGIKYKIGPNYQRLRQALVRKARQKFVMPRDSQHPDREANHQIYVETWLTEEEYQDAKSKQLLAWQEPPPRSPEAPEKLSLNISDTVPFPPSSTGKNLLWSTSTNSTPTSSGLDGLPESGRIKNYRHSIATSVGLPINPFATSQVPTAKRIASTTRANSLVSSISGSPGLSDSTNGSPRMPHKVFSKWEKQELEAQAMMKMREANRKKELEKEARLKEERERAERAAAEKLRIERERLEREERERAEKERQQREAAEAERKAKEAQKAPPPSITVTAPSSDNIGQPPSTTGSGPSGFFSTNIPNSSTPSAPSLFAQKPENTPFSQPSGFNKPAEQNPSSSSQPSGSAQPSTGSSNFFTSSSAPAAGKPNFFSPNPEPKKEGAEGASAGASLFSRMGPPANPEPPKSTTQPAANPIFSFKPAGQAASNNTSSPFAAPQAASSTPAAPPTTTPKFNFSAFSNKNAAPASDAAATAKSTPTSAFPSTTSTLNGALGSDQKGSSQSTPAAFSFKQPTTPASAINSNNFNATTTPSTTPAGSTTTSTTPAAPKFSFTGFSSNQNKEPAKSSFGTTTTPSAFGNTTTTTTPSPFGSTTTPSPFGNPPNQNKEPVKSAFSATSSGPSPFGSSTTPSAFGNNSAPSPFGSNTNTQSAFSSNAGSGPSPFGATTAQTQNVFGGSSNTATANKSAEAPKSQFGFNGFNAASSAAPAPATNTTTTTPAPLFSFGNTNSQTPAAAPAAATTTPAAPKFSFNFGQSAGSTTPKTPFGGQ
ncbi:hypothetical protein M413DRAFT_449991 [Hebeloma cylindrosporum]|uniref:Uncharacterized protein n=1 Tax=Hebeloma cylindrosporum TaxID=76867 RepID=A0A0C3BDS1_HEBCY|nr:hypothetical protein M413DRAFT_449991 [Hebeloma cylindrosporum h7]